MAEEFFKDGRLSGTGDYLDGERHGHWTFYFRNGQVKSEAGYVNGQLDGLCLWYREGGGLLQKGSFRDAQANRAKNRLVMQLRLISAMRSKRQKRKSL
jgi:antitoxin component YwqK of YwqJK toxin-antitoxin module